MGFLFLFHYRILVYLHTPNGVFGRLGAELR